MERINKFLMLEFEADNNKKYKIKAIQDRAIYIKEVGRHLSKLYYLII